MVFVVVVVVVVILNKFYEMLCLAVVVKRMISSVEFITDLETPSLYPSLSYSHIYSYIHTLCLLSRIV